MWIATSDHQWFIHEIRGAVFVSWVQASDKAHACVFPEGRAHQWLETMKQAASRDDLVLVRPFA